MNSLSCEGPSPASLRKLWRGDRRHRRRTGRVRTSSAPSANLQRRGAQRAPLRKDVCEARNAGQRMQNGSFPSLWRSITAAYCATSAKALLDMARTTTLTLQVSQGWSGRGDRGIVCSRPRLRRPPGGNREDWQNTIHTWLRQCKGYCKHRERSMAKTTVL